MLKKLIKSIKKDGIISSVNKIKFSLKLFFKRDHVLKVLPLYISRKQDNLKLKAGKKIALVSKHSCLVDENIFETINLINAYGFQVANFFSEETEEVTKIIPAISIGKFKVNYLFNDYDLVLIDENISNDEFQKLNNKLICNLSDFKIEDLESRFKYESQYLNKNLSIVVLNYNNLNVIEKCIDTLIKYNDYNYEIIVVDNGSTDGSYELLNTKYDKQIKILRNSINGCSSGRNLGVSASLREYILFLDSDQWVTNNNWVSNYEEILMRDKNIGLIGWTGGWFNEKGLASMTVDYFPMRYMPPSALYRSDIGYLGSGGMLIKRDLFNQINGFDIKYDPTCYEDTDISLKVRNFGLEIAYCPYLGIKHLPHQTTKSGTSNHDNLIQEKGDYFSDKWKKIDKSLLNYRK